MALDFTQYTDKGYEWNKYRLVDPSTTQEQKNIVTKIDDAQNSEESQNPTKDNTCKYKIRLMA